MWVHCNCTVHCECLRIQRGVINLVYFIAKSDPLIWYLTSKQQLICLMIMDKRWIIISLLLVARSNQDFFLIVRVCVFFSSRTNKQTNKKQCLFLRFGYEIHCLLYSDATLNIWDVKLVAISARARAVRVPIKSKQAFNLKWKACTCLVVWSLGIRFKLSSKLSDLRCGQQIRANKH